MKKRINLDMGFLVLYEWLPLFKTLCHKDYRLLMDALFERQRENKPLPVFGKPLLNNIARTIEAVIERRLAGAAWAQKGLEEASTPEATPEGSPTTKEERREEKKSEDEMSEAEQREEVSPTPPPAALRALSEDEKNFLEGEGLPAAYIEAREARACEYANSSGRDVLAVLCDWWKQDKRSFLAAQKRSTQAVSSSFEADDFWQAALARTYGESPPT